MTNVMYMRIEVQFWIQFNTKQVDAIFKNNQEENSCNVVIN